MKGGGNPAKDRSVPGDGTISTTGKLRWEKQLTGVYNPDAGGATPLSRPAGWKTASDVSAGALEGRAPTG